MVDSVSSSSAMASMMTTPSTTTSTNASSLTDEQTATLTDVLSSYDADSLTEAQAQEIVAALSEAGIEPGAGLEEAMSELGFDAKTIGDLAGLGPAKGEQGPPPPPPMNATEDADVASYLSELIAAKLAESGETELTEAEMAEIQVTVAEEFGLEEGEALIDVSV